MLKVSCEVEIKGAEDFFRKNISSKLTHQRLKLDGKEPFSPGWIVCGLTDGKV
ncbi:hypothetical protein ABN296_22705 [Enterobacter hormaechei]|uniref:hypothetical protein n=1 Tax=Enterobacter hormaechei TaxID=158836 RepID=UPI0032D9BEC8